MKLFDGKLHAQIIEKELADRVSIISEIPELAIIQIGDNQSSYKYVNLKVKLCERLGIPVNVYNFDIQSGKDEILKRVTEVFKIDHVGGGIVQLPLPNPEWEEILQAIPIEKDLDLLSSTSQSKFYSGDFSKLPPVVLAVKLFLEINQINPRDLKVCVIGEGFLVGRPVSCYLQELGAEVEIVNDYKPGKHLDCQLAVLSVGIPGLVDGYDLSQNCHVVDFGSSVVEGKTVGDLDMKSRIEHLGVVSPSPGGMGPLVVRFLIKNFVDRL